MANFDELLAIVREMGEVRRIAIADWFASDLPRATRCSPSMAARHAWQPFDMGLHNSISERPPESPENALFFSSTEGGSNWCFLEDFQESYRADKADARKQFSPIRDWPDFWTWLLEEPHWWEGLFDAQGRPITSTKESASKQAQ